MIDADFFRRCALISVDFQEDVRPEPIAEADLPPDWREMGFTADDVNAANAFAWDVALPNALRVIEACRKIGNCPKRATEGSETGLSPIFRIFIHWGYQFEDGMDLDPVIRSMMLRNHGKDYALWHGHIHQPGSRPPGCFKVQEDEYVLAKSAQDAFASCNLGFVLANLGVDNLIFIGGHTEACLGKTAASAKRLGFRTLCVADATTNARESTRLKGIREAEFDRITGMEELLTLLSDRPE